MKRLLLVATIFLTLVFASTVLADRPWDSDYVGRSWKNPDTTMRARLYYPYFKDGADRSLLVYVTIRLTDLAPLRLGEEEEFRVEGSVRADERGRYRLRLRCEPASSWYDYPVCTKSVYIGDEYTKYVTLRFGHDGHLELGAAPSVDKAAVNYDTPAEPVQLKWRDYGFDENGQVESEYKFFIYRDRYPADDKLVAWGTVPRADADFQTVLIAEDGPYTYGADEWFEVGSTYRVSIQIKRMDSEWYTNEFGPAYNGFFDWTEDDDKGVLALEKRTTGQREQARRTNERFSDLHGE